MKQGVLIGVAAALGLAGSSMGQEVIIPNFYGTTPGDGGLNTLLRDADNPRTYQTIVDANHLLGIPTGSAITGVTWRTGITANNPASWPTGTYSYSDYEIYVGKAALAVGSGSTVLSQNVVSESNVQVKDGSMTIPAGSFVKGTLPGVSPWGHFIEFDTPYVYTGGSLVFTFRHGGADQTGTIFLDAVYSAGANGVESFAAGSKTATEGEAANSILFRISYGETTGCYADCDESSSLDFFDVLCFLNEFGEATAYADCDESSSLDFFDVLCFLNKFGEGC